MKGHAKIKSTTAYPFLKNKTKLKRIKKKGLKATGKYKSYISFINIPHHSICASLFA